jgi:ankyrin repeat protein
MIAARYSGKDSTNKTVKLLIDAGTNVNIQSDYEWTALMIAAYYSGKDSTNETVKILIDAGANLNIQNSDGWTALMITIRNSENASIYETVRLLINADADFKLKDNYGTTTFDMLMKNKNTDATLIKIMLEKDMFTIANIGELLQKNLLDINTFRDYLNKKSLRKRYSKIIINIKMKYGKIIYKPDSIASKTLIYNNYMKIMSKQKVYELMCKNDPFLIKYFNIYDVDGLSKLQ